MEILEIRELPLTLDLAKQHLRVGDSTHDDELIRAKLEMAVAVAEDMTGRLIRERTVGFHVRWHSPSSFAPRQSSEQARLCSRLGVGCPADDMILLTLPAHTSRVEELSVSGKVISEDEYTLLPSQFAHSLFINSSLGGQRVYIKAVVGYTQADIPPAIKAAILLILGTLYDNESDQIVGRAVSELSLTAEKLLAPWRVTPYGDV